MELVLSQNESICIGFIEKAFDFENRCDLVRCMMSEKVGSIFTKSIASMYEITYYVPKISAN